MSGKEKYNPAVLAACLADEEMKLEEEKIDELTKKEEYEMIKAQLTAKRMEEDRKIAEEKRSGEMVLELLGKSQVLVN